MPYHTKLEACAVFVVESESLRGVYGLRDSCRDSCRRMRRSELHSSCVPCVLRCVGEGAASAGPRWYTRKRAPQPSMRTASRLLGSLSVSPGTEINATYGMCVAAVNIRYDDHICLICVGCARRSTESQMVVPTNRYAENGRNCRCIFRARGAAGHPHRQVRSQPRRSLLH